jgi:WD40 repeat protein
MSQEISIVESIRHHDDAVLSVAFHPTAPILATGSRDHQTILYELPLNNQLLRLMTNRHDEQIRSVAFHPTEIILATGGDNGAAKLYRLSSDNSSANCVATLDGHAGAIHSVVFHPTGEFLATGSQDYTVKLWKLSPDRSSAECIATLHGHTGAVLSVAFHPCGEFLATGSEDKTVKLWKMLPDRSSANCMTTLYGRIKKEPFGDVKSVAFDPTGELLATGSYNTALLWKISVSASLDTLSATFARTLSDKKSGPDTPVVSVAFDPKGEFLATGDTGNTAKLWKLSRNANKLSVRCVSTLMVPAVPDEKKGLRTRFLSVVFHPIKQILVGGSSNRCVTLWDYSKVKKGVKGGNSITHHSVKRSSRRVKRHVSKTKRYRSK